VGSGGQLTPNRRDEVKAISLTPSNVWGDVVLMFMSNVEEHIFFHEKNQNAELRRTAFDQPHRLNLVNIHQMARPAHPIN